MPAPDLLGFGEPSPERGPVQIVGGTPVVDVKPAIDPPA
jgi:hypothetical protein